MKQLNEINGSLLNFLNKNISKKGFPLKSYYGETHAAAAFSLANKNTKPIINLISAYLKKDKSDPDTHWEFNNSALQQVNKKNYKNLEKIIYPLFFNVPFYRKVTNWMLLRALIYLKSPNKKDHVKGDFIAKSTLFSHQRKGIIYDNRFTRKKTFSDQYHAFATSLLGEIALLTKKSFYFKRFKQAFMFLKKRTNTPLTFNTKGRGSKQIFGYASAIHALVLGGFLFKDKDALNRAESLIIYLKKFQRKDGSFPLTLTKSEFKFNSKKYKNNLKIPGWESYNRYYDYLAFTALYLQKTLNFIKQNK